MSPVQRVVLNTISQYGKTITNVILGLYSTRVVLSALGSNDFGTYSLIGGVIAMLGFMTNALMITTQRFMSFYQGKNDVKKSRIVFENSVNLHILLGIVLVLILLIVSRFLFDGYLSILPERLYAAECIYYTVTLSLFVTFCTAPFKALLVSHENIVFVSIVDVLDGVLKVVVAFIVSSCCWDKLIFYGILMGGISIFNFFSFFIYSKVKYREASDLHLCNFDRFYLRDLFSFAVWTSFSSFCLFVKNQGIAIVINRICGTVVNASYGIAFNVSSSVQFVCLSVCNAINPQLMKAEGEDNRNKMIRLCEIESKFAFVLMSMICIPCVFEMPVLLKLWLGNVPDYAVFFCRCVIIAATMDQMTIGIGAAMQAVGNIKKYNLVIYTVKLGALPLALIVKMLDLGVEYIMLGFVITEFISSLLRIYFLKDISGASIKFFFKRVIIKSMFPILLVIIFSVIVFKFYLFDGRLIISFVGSIFVTCLTMYFVALENDEKYHVTRMILGLYNKING
ncbi:MAG: hypothetical protein U0K66_13360 [Paludibacteraceae bacterium]|jgi:Na+-driven multidrug efflux pump|nr:hypothetical protein [Paludibacteraceae bacterium]